MPRLGERLDFKATSSAENEHLRVIRDMFVQENPGHSLQVGKAGHHPCWPFGVACNGLGIRPLLIQHSLDDP